MSSKWISEGRALELPDGVRPNTTTPPQAKTTTEDSTANEMLPKEEVTDSAKSKAASTPPDQIHEAVAETQE